MNRTHITIAVLSLGAGFLVAPAAIAEDESAHDAKVEQLKQDSEDDWGAFEKKMDGGIAALGAPVQKGSESSDPAAALKVPVEDEEADTDAETSDD